MLKERAISILSYEIPFEDFETPAFIYDENTILSNLDVSKEIRTKTCCKILFPLKPFSIPDALHLMVPHLDGFSTSSVFEAKLSREVLGKQKPVHITTPGFTYDDMAILSDLCDYISFNSLSQWKRYHEKVGSKASCGLRINPQFPFVKDERYDPCRKNSKLGVPLNKLSEISNNEPNALKDVKGLHFHTNCESTEFSHLLRTVQHIDAYLARLLGEVDWVNLGGGYLFEKTHSLDKLIETVTFLRTKYDVEVFFEPGKAIIGAAGYIISTIIDMFESDGKTIAILDTTVNHMPEVFEYQFQPDVLGHSDNCRHSYILAGCTCLPGDEFGEYSFDEPLEIGGRVVFSDVGAYTLVKAHMFNGVNLPTIYAYTQDGKLEMKKQFDYEDFKSRCGVKKNVTV